MRLVIVAVVCMYTVAAAQTATDDLAPVKESVVRLYDRGAYDEARALLQQLDAARALDGPLLYRLFFCEKSTRHDDDARKALDRAREALESVAAASRTLEGAFYLANAYVNLGRAEDARNVAREMTATFESAKLPPPTTAIGQFQLGKLYQDQGRQTEALASYSQAIQAFDVSDGRYVSNLRWALRYVGNAAMSRLDFASSEVALTRLAASGAAEAADLDSLAAARIRLGKYAVAADAWRALIQLDPANADDPRYASRLADQAALVGPLPLAPAGGVAFTSMSQTDLETLMKSAAEAVAVAQAQAAEAMQRDAGGLASRALDPKLRAEIGESLRKTRQQFIAAGLEYALRHYGIRETAFREGYAALIFQDRAWEVPPDPEPTSAPSAEEGS